MQPAESSQTQACTAQTMQTLKESKLRRRARTCCSLKPPLLPSCCQFCHLPPAFCSSARSYVRPRHIWEIIQMRTRCFFCLRPSVVTGKQAFMISISRSRTAIATPLRLSLSSPLNPLEEHPGHYERPLMRAWHGVLSCDAPHIRAIHQSLGDT